MRAPALADISSITPADSALEFRMCPCARLRAGRLDTANARYVLALLDRALAGCRSGEFAAMVTAPVHKGVINDAGIPFTGHTEYLAEKTATPGRHDAGGCGPARRAGDHASAAEGRARRHHARDLETTIRILHADLVTSSASPDRASLSPASIRTPARAATWAARRSTSLRRCWKLRGEGMDLIGPLPADTLFTPGVLAGSDAQLAMYHDQGLAVLKYAAFDDGINVTLGLPIIRTRSITAPRSIWRAPARPIPRSLFAAVDLAIDLAQRRSSAGSAKLRRRKWLGPP